MSLSSDVVRRAAKAGCRRPFDTSTPRSSAYGQLIRLYLVAPDERRDKVEQEILRPTFSLREKPLRDVCGFLAFSKLVEKADGIRNLGIAASLRPDFLIQTAEYFKEEDAG